MPSTSKMINIIDVFTFCQSVVQPTHVRGHVLDWVMYRSEADSVLQWTSVSQALTSGHYCMTCDPNVALPLLSPVFREVRTLRSLDKSAFCEGLRTVLPPSDCSSDQLDSALRGVLDKHTPVRRPRERRAGSSPWYPEIREDLRDSKQS